MSRQGAVPFGDAIYTNFGVPLQPGEQAVCIAFVEDLLTP